MFDGVEVQTEDGARASGGALRRFVSPEIDTRRSTGIATTHAASLEARTIFPSTVVPSADSPRCLVGGENNPKLGGKITKGSRAGWPIYHLTLEERATCPTSCRLWSNCYGNAMHRARRHAADGNLIPLLQAEVTHLSVINPTGFMIRLHTLGDFYSVEYVEAWREMLIQHPALHIFGYTAREDADPIGRAVIGIADAQWERFAIRTSRSVAVPQGALVVDEPHNELLMCPAQTKETETCGTCGLCWSKSARLKTIGFLRHGMKAPMATLTLDTLRRLEELADMLLAKHPSQDAAETELMEMVWADIYEVNEDDRWLGDEVVGKGAQTVINAARARANSGRVVNYNAANTAEKPSHEAPPQKLLPEAMIVRWGASVAAGFNFMLPDGTKLGDATRLDLTKAADKFTAFGKEAHQKARWLLLIAQGLPEGQTVRDRYKTVRLTELAIEAEKITEPTP